MTEGPTTSATSPTGRAAWLRRARHHSPLNDHVSFNESTGLRIVFEATQTQPDYAKLFLSSGGAINTAAGAGPTDFSLTDSTASIKAVLGPNDSKTITIDLPRNLILDNGDSPTVAIDSCAKLNYSSQRVGAAINGTLVDTKSGQGSVYLANFLRMRESHVQCPAVYGTLASHACTIGCSNMRIETADGKEVDVAFVEDTDKQAKLDKAEELVDAWAHGAWDVREHMVYGLSPTLTKSVAKVPVGVNDKGYELVHNVIDQEFPFGLTALNSMFENAIGMELEYNPDDIQQMKDATSRPGMRAAVWAQTAAAACSTVANYLVAYRADGRTVMQATGSGFESTESWLRTPMRTPCEANDCDGSGLVVTTMLQTAIDATEEELENHPYLRVVKNAVFPYYVFGIAVVGATSAEASAGGGEADSVAGHALALMVPTLSFLDGLDRAASDGHTVGSEKVSHDSKALRAARLSAVFNDDVLATLPEHEQEKLRTGNLSSWEQATRLQPYAIEGTTPASPVLYMADSEKRRAVMRDAELDQKAFSAAAPNVGRSLKVLHVGGKKTDDPHRFYHDFVELSIHPSHPLYSHQKVRELGEGATQYVFGKMPTGTALVSAGTTPRALSNNDFVLVPMHRVDTHTGETLDFAADVSKRDVVPPRAGPMMMTASQSRDVRRSITALKALDTKLSKDEVPGHCVAYIFAYSSLVNNPLAIEHFCERVQKAAVAGIVDFRMVDGLALHPGEGGEQAGYFVVANVVMQV